MSRVPCGFRGVDAADGSFAYAGPSLLKRKLEANQVRLVAIRHGESQSNADSDQIGQPLLYGRSESPLTQKGIQQAKDCAVVLYRQLGGDDWLKSCVDEPRKLPIFCASTVSRSMDSSQILVDYLKGKVTALCGQQALNELSPWLVVHPEPRLLETDFGIFEKHPMSDLQAAYPVFTQNWRPPQGMGTDFRHRFPHGESRVDTMGRVSSFLDAAAQFGAGRTVILMSHSEAVLGVRTALGLAPQQDGKVRAETSTVTNATPYWLVGQPTVG